MSQLMMKLPTLKIAEAVGNPSMREADAADSAGLAHLLGAAFAEQKWTVDRVVGELLEADDVAATYVIDGDDGPVATASARYVQRFPESGYVHWVAVDPAHRGKRLGTLIMATVLQRFSADGRHSAILETDDYRLPAIASYLGQGFIPHYVDSDHEDRWSLVFQQLANGRKASQGK